MLVSVGNLIPRVIRQGEYLKKLAADHGFDPREVWNDPANAQLAQLRTNPNLLVEGDILYIPDTPPVWLPVQVGEVNRFVGTVATNKLTLKLVAKGKALANATCRITGVPGMSSATTDGEGTLQLVVPLSVTSVTIDVDSPRFHAVARVGHLDPPDTDSGVRMRLRNLQYLHDHSVTDDDCMKLAISNFQADQGIEVSGALDDATRAALVEAHGC